VTVPAESSRGAAAKEPGKGPPPRPPAEIIRDLERERAGLVDAVDRLKVQSRATRDRFVAPRTLAIAGSALVSLILFRRWRKAG